ncbi:hypothetical protein CMV_004280 [Castanea mollissima]|uniref:F-box domain-containing protein n=1 Tax=Castanea mollissima TaxID=60419 RepID=A0A8J4RYH2_9ROSI|nr:hypothetical protein CMV_004280 [Castanea mollissima]
METRTKYLPEEILTNILLRLPVKSLIRFRLVCKSWFTFLHKPNFIATHLNYSSANNCHHLLVHTQAENHAISLLSNKTLNLIDSPRTPKVEREVIVGSCNGLVCLSRDSEIVLWNPATKEHKVLPTPCISTEFFNPLITWSIGFGFHVEDYKVVRMVNTNYLLSGKITPKVEVYSTSSGSWRVINAIIPCYVEQRRCSVVLKGVPYWLGFGPICPNTIFVPRREVLREEFVLSFDMGNEVFLQVDVPGAKDYHYTYSKKLGVYNESVAIMYYPSYEKDIRFIELWVMKEDHVVDECWVQVLRIGPFSTLWTPLGCWESGVVILQNHKDELLLYDPTIGKAKAVPTNGAPKFSTSIATYMESLVSVDGGNKDLKEIKSV